MRGTYVVCYDIADPRRLRRVFKLMRNWGDHLQLSVFRCELSPEELLHMEAEVISEIHHTDDQVLIVYIGPSEGRADSAFKALGKSLLEHDRGVTVV
jgi:CRISPR-associated protein Cas2